MPQLKQKRTFFEAFGRLSRTARYGISLLILIVVLILGYFFDTSSLLQKIKNAKTQFATLTAQLNTTKQKLAQQKQYIHQLASLEGYVAKITKGLSAQIEQSAILKQIHTIGANQQIQFNLIKPSPLVKKDFYSILPIKIVITGDYHRIAKFISDISILKHPIVLEQLALKHDAQQSHFMTISMLANIFVPDPSTLKAKYYPKRLSKDKKMSSNVFPKPIAEAKYDQEKLRNPFTNMKKARLKKYAFVVLPNTPLSQIILNGIIHKKNKKWAIIMPTGKNNVKMTFSVVAGDRISQSQALITAITDDSMTLEKDVGDEENPKTETVTLSLINKK